MPFFVNWAAITLNVLTLFYSFEITTNDLFPGAIISRVFLVLHFSVCNGTDVIAHSAQNSIKYFQYFRGRRNFKKR